MTVRQLFLTHTHNNELKLDSDKANLTVEGHRLINIAVSSILWRPCTNLFILLEYKLLPIKINSTL